MKKFFCIILAMAVVFGIFSVIGASAEGAKVTLMGTGGTKGNLVDVRVTLSGNSGADSFALNLEYDSSALIIYDIKDMEVLEGAYHGYNSEAEAFQLCWTNGGSGNGTLAIITFMITEAAENKNYAITAEGEEIEVIGGFVNVTEEATGDVTDDGKADTDDVNYIAKYTAGWAGAEAPEVSGDVNGDGRVNLLDAIIIARFAAGMEGYSIDGEKEETETPVEIENDMDEQ